MGGFSPGRGDMLLALEGVLGPDKPDDTHQILVLNIATQERMMWDTTLRPCLPHGEILPHGIGWLPTVPAYTFETCTLMVHGVNKTYSDEALLSQLFVAKGYRVVQCTMRMRKGNSQSWALVTLGDHSACLACCEDGHVIAPGVDMKISQVKKEKAESSTGAFADTWTAARKKAAEADANEDSHLFEADQPAEAAKDYPKHHKHHHEARFDVDVEDDEFEDLEQDDLFGNTEGVPAPLLLYAAAENELVVMDMRQFKFAAEDGALSEEQLRMLSLWDPEAIPDLTVRLPNAVNTRSARSGDTVLHGCVRHNWPDRLESWLWGSTEYTPIPNFMGHTALHEAIANHSRLCVTVLFKNMIPSLNDVSSPLVTEALRLLSREMPELSLQVLQMLEERSSAHHDDDNFTDDSVAQEGAVIQTTREFHDKFHAGDEGTGAIVMGCPSRSFEVGQWNNQLPTRHHMATEMEVASKVVAMADFIGNPHNSPFWDLVENSSSDPQVFESKLLQLAVQFKWQKVAPLARWSLMLYICHFTIMCFTLLYDTQSHLELNICAAGSGNIWGDGSVSSQQQQQQLQEPSPIQDEDVVTGATGCAYLHGATDCWIKKTTVLDGLYLALTITNSYMLWVELREVYDSIKEALEEDGTIYQGLKAFCGDVWNFFDVGSIAMVYWAGVAHYSDDPCQVEQVGAMAIILNSISVLQLMRPFTQTGALIQTIIEIIKDIRGFWYICTVILVGFTCAFTVCEPQVPAFTMKDARVGPFYPLIEVVISMIGAFR